jgi:hypothetical protein
VSASAIERIVDPATGRILAIVIRDGFRAGKYNFITPNEFSMQVGVNFYQDGDVIKPHLHLEQRREIGRTQEFIYVKVGRVRLHVYDEAKSHIAAVELGAGDSVMLASGGHGFDVLAAATLVEAKQGPFSPSSDKVTFE